MTLFTHLILVIVCSQLVRAADTDSFQLSGRVLSSCFIVINDAPIATNLDLIGSGHSATPIANVQVVSNSIAFATVMGISDTHGGELVSTTDPSDTIPYTLNYVSSDTGTNNTNFSVPSSASPMVLDFSFATGGFSGDLSLNLTANPTLDEGVYETNITVDCTIL